MSKLETRQHETRDINTRAVACFGLALVVGAIAIHVMLAGMFHRLDERRPTGAAANRIAIDAPKMQPPEPRLQTDPARDFTKFREREDALLHSYGWVDRAAGVVRIPIERAMDLIAQRGLPAPSETAGKTPVEMRQEKATEPPQ